MPSTDGKGIRSRGGMPVRMRREKEHDEKEVQKGQKVILKGVLWIASGDPKLFYDSEHVTVVE